MPCIISSPLLSAPLSSSHLLSAPLLSSHLPYSLARVIQSNGSVYFDTNAFSSAPSMTYGKLDPSKAVSYTHLTLPTILLV